MLLGVISAKLFYFLLQCSPPSPDILTGCSYTCMGSFIQNAWDFGCFLNVNSFHNLEHLAYSLLQQV